MSGTFPSLMYLTNKIWLYVSRAFSHAIARLLKHHLVNSDFGIRPTSSLWISQDHHIFDIYWDICQFKMASHSVLYRYCHNHFFLSSDVCGWHNHPVSTSEWDMEDKFSFEARRAWTIFKFTHGGCRISSWYLSFVGRYPSSIRTVLWSSIFRSRFHSESFPRPPY